MRMMTNKLFLFLTLLTLSSVVTAHEEYWHFSAGVGQSSLSPEGQGWQLTDDSDTAYSLGAGYQHNRWFIDLSYQDLGQAVLNSALVTPTQSAMIDYEAWDVSMGYYFTGKKNRFKPFVGLGVAYVTSDSSQLLLDDSSTNLSVMLGADWFIDKNNSLRLAYQRMDEYVDSLMLSYRYRF